MPGVILPPPPEKNVAWTAGLAVQSGRTLAGEDLDRKRFGMCRSNFERAERGLGGKYRVYFVTPE